MYIGVLPGLAGQGWAGGAGWGVGLQLPHAGNLRKALKFRR